MSPIKPGDYLIVQFGHNDMKDKSANASDTYKSDLKKLVADARAKGAIPILVTSMERKSGIARHEPCGYNKDTAECAASDASESSIVELGPRTCAVTLRRRIVMCKRPIRLLSIILVSGLALTSSAGAADPESCLLVGF